MRVLVADDDPGVREVVTLALERAGIGVVGVSDGASALREAERGGVDLLVLDIGMPRMDGLEVVRRLRARSDLPVLFLTAQGEEADRVLGLEMGGDDYVAKPFSPRELVARVRAIVKRARGELSPGPLRRGALTLDLEARACAVAGRPVALTAQEMALLGRLMRRPDHVTTRAQVAEALWGPGAEESERTVDSHLRNLRRKLAAAGCADAVETVHGMGLRMGPCGGA